MSEITTRRGELFHWTAIVFSNTLGTALSDFLADDSGLGFGGGALLIGSLVVLVVLAHYFTRISPVLLFWVAYVLTRPFGTTFGDLLTRPVAKPGLGFNTQGSSLSLLGLLVPLVVYAALRPSPPSQWPPRSRAARQRRRPLRISSLPFLLISA